jgi:5,10-methylenetetrahydromethanopterin reductase
VISGGVNLIPEDNVGRIVELACEAERLGYERCWVYDEGLVTRDPYVVMSAIAARTGRIQLGTGITNPYTRHPAVTAASVATLDELSGGRAFLGLGAGGSITLGPLGIPRTKPLTATREAIETTRRLYQGQAVSYEGKTVNLVDARIEYARSDIEIWLAGRGPKMLRMGGELADGVVLDFLYKEHIQEYVDLVREGAARSGNQPRICYSTMIITSEEGLDRVRPHMTYRLVDSPPQIKEILGISEAQSEEIREAMISGGIFNAGRLIRDEWVRPFIIMGSVDECAAELTALMERHGMDEFLLPVLDLDDAPELMASVAQVLAAAAAGANGGNE